MSVKVLYVAGVSYSGTTLLGNAVGQVDGFFYGGELRNVWRRGFIENRPCGCGLRFFECPLWTAIRAHAFHARSDIDAREMADVERERSRTRELIRLAASGDTRRLPSPAVRRYSALEESFYGAIQQTVGCRVIVDSSKSPAYAHFLDSLGLLDVYVVHVVRDPRGSAYSGLRRGVRGSRSRELAGRALVWDTWNLCAERLWRNKGQRYMRVRYEDFVSDPVPVIHDVLTMLSEEGTVNFVGERALELRENHTFSANRARFEKGTVKLRPDTEWIGSMRLLDRMLVTSLTLPFLRRYAYRVQV